VRSRAGGLFFHQKLIKTHKIFISNLKAFGSTVDESIIITIFFITLAFLILIGFYFTIKLNSNLSEKGEKTPIKVFRYGPFLRKEYFNETGRKYRNYLHYLAIVMFMLTFLFVILMMFSLQLKKVTP